jgi:hypothetical protein
MTELSRLRPHSHFQRRIDMTESFLGRGFDGISISTRPK